MTGTQINGPATNPMAAIAITTNGASKTDKQAEPEKKSRTDSNVFMRATWAATDARSINAGGKPIRCEKILLLTI